MIGMMPHSHMGNGSPSRPPARMAHTRLRGMMRVMSCCGTNSSSTPAMIAPRTMNGIASYTMLVKNSMN